MLEIIWNHPRFVLFCMFTFTRLLYFYSISNPYFRSPCNSYFNYLITDPVELINSSTDGGGGGFRSNSVWAGDGVSIVVWMKGRSEWPVFEENKQNYWYKIITPYELINPLQIRIHLNI